MSSAPQTLARPAEGSVPGQLAVVAGAIVLGLAVGAVARPAETWAGVLTAALFGLTIALGGAIFVAIQAVSGGRWWLPIRGVPLLVARTLLVPAVALGLALIFGLTVLYPWARADVVTASPLLQAKAVWLNVPFFLARAAVVIVLWAWAISALHQRLKETDGPGSASWSRLARTSAGFLVLLGVTLSVASWDWVMSLEPEWYSTMYTVYVFAGAFQGALAAIALVTDAFERSGHIAPVPAATRHDLGKLLFAFSTFWAYIWFCQLMLIWYANLPEETLHYVSRWGAGWSLPFFLAFAFCWVVPFVVLLSAPAKRHAATLRTVAAIVLLGRFVDCHLLVAPALGPAEPFPFAAVGATLVVAFGMLVYGRRLRQGEA